jgi:uncharacterized protein (UPF0248 family)
MTRYIALAVLALVCACEDPTGGLVGEWTVDEAATIALAGADQAFALKDTLGALTKGLTISFEANGDAVVTDKGNRRTSRFTIVEQGDNSLLLQLKTADRNHRVLAVVKDGRVVLAENRQHIVLRRL